MPTWRLYDWSRAGPPSGNRRVYSKWQYIAADDVFVGLSFPTTGMWVYKHPAAMAGIALADLGRHNKIRRNRATCFLQRDQVPNPGPIADFGGRWRWRPP